MTTKDQQQQDTICDSSGSVSSSSSNEPVGHRHQQETTVPRNLTTAATAVTAATATTPHSQEGGGDDEMGIDHEEQQLSGAVGDEQHHRHISTIDADTEKNADHVDDGEDEDDIPAVDPEDHDATSEERNQQHAEQHQVTSKVDSGGDGDDNEGGVADDEDAAPNITAPLPAVAPTVETAESSNDVDREPVQHVASLAVGEVIVTDVEHNHARGSVIALEEGLTAGVTAASVASDVNASTTISSGICVALRKDRIVQCIVIVWVLLVVGSAIATGFVVHWYRKNYTQQVSSSSSLVGTEQMKETSVKPAVIGGLVALWVAVLSYTMISYIVIKRRQKSMAKRRIPSNDRIVRCIVIVWVLLLVGSAIATGFVVHWYRNNYTQQDSLSSSPDGKEQSVGRSLIPVKDYRKMQRWRLDDDGADDDGVEQPSLSAAPSELPPYSAYPSGLRSLSLHPSQQLPSSDSQSEQPSTSPRPSGSGEPSSQPSISVAPSGSGKPSEQPSMSGWPSSQPSISVAPSSSGKPSEQPSMSGWPSLSKRPSISLSDHPSLSLEPTSLAIDGDDEWWSAVDDDDDGWGDDDDDYDVGDDDDDDDQDDDRDDDCAGRDDDCAERDDDYTEDDSIPDTLPIEDGIPLGYYFKSLYRVPNSSTAASGVTIQCDLPTNIAGLCVFEREDYATIEPTGNSQTSNLPKGFMSWTPTVSAQALVLGACQDDFCAIECLEICACTDNDSGHACETTTRPPTAAPIDDDDDEAPAPAPLPSAEPNEYDEDDDDDDGLPYVNNGDDNIPEDDDDEAPAPDLLPPAEPNEDGEYSKDDDLWTDDDGVVSYNDDDDDDYLDDDDDYNADVYDDDDDDYVENPVDTEKMKGDIAAWAKSDEDDAGNGGTTQQALEEEERSADERTLMRRTVIGWLVALWVLVLAFTVVAYNIVRTRSQKWKAVGK